MWEPEFYDSTNFFFFQDFLRVYYIAIIFIRDFASDTTCFVCDQTRVGAVTVVRYTTIGGSVSVISKNLDA